MRPRFRILYAPVAERSLRKLPGDVRRRILAKIEALAADPWQPGAMKLTGMDAYRVRVGDYRIVYKVDGGRLIVLVLDVGHRKDIYRGL